MRKPLAIFIALLGVFLLSQCEKEDDENRCESDTGRFSYSLFPLDKLSDYGFFDNDMSLQTPSEGIIPYDVITPLFSDYAHKKRFIYIPEDKKATYNGDHEVLDMPDGTIIIKTFYYDNVMPSSTTQLMETRLLYKVDGFWEFADYVWNETQEEAYFDLNGSNVPIQFENDFGNLISADYRIPSETECKICHKILNESFPIGPKPQNLNKDYIYEDGEMNQLEKWIELGMLESEEIPEIIETVADWKNESLPKFDRVRAYIDINCAHCHRGESHCSYRDMRFAWNETIDEDNLGVCMDIAEPIDPLQLYVVAPSSPSKSMMYYRLNTTEPSEMMPLIGRTVIHEEGALLIKEWIEELSQSCD